MAVMKFHKQQGKGRVNWKTCLQKEYTFMHEGKII